jgi:hypothetical protein
VGEAEFVGFKTDEEKKYQAFIKNAMQAVWGTDRFNSMIGTATLTRDYFGGGWFEPGKVTLGVQSFYSSEEREVAANIALHEIVVGHGMDPFCDYGDGLLTHSPSGNRALDMRDTLAHRAKWFAVSRSAEKFLASVGGPEHARQVAFDEAKESLSDDKISQLKEEQSDIYSVSSSIGQRIRNDEYSGDPNLQAIQHDIDNLDFQSLTDEHKDTATALSVCKELDSILELSEGQCVNDLNHLLIWQVRQEQEMIAEVMRHVLINESSPSPDFETEFKELETFVDFVLKLYGGRKTLTQARSDLKKVINNYTA